jgi:hypothetical protein
VYEFPGAMGHCVTIAAEVVSVSRETIENSRSLTYVHLQMRCDLGTGGGQSRVVPNGGCRYVPNRANEPRYFACESNVNVIGPRGASEINAPHERVSQLIVDRNVKGISGRSLDERSRERAIDKHRWSTEPVRGNVRVHDVEHIVHVGCESGDGKESELSEELERRGERNHGTWVLQCLARDEAL